MSTIYHESMKVKVCKMHWFYPAYGCPIDGVVLLMVCSVYSVINDVDDYWHGVEVWLLWHLTSSLVNIWSSGNQTSSHSKHHFLLLHFISRDSADSCQAHQYFGFKTTSHQYLRNICQTEENCYINKVDMEQIPTKPTQPVLCSTVATRINIMLRKRFKS